MPDNEGSGPIGGARKELDRRRFLAYDLGGIAVVAAAGAVGIDLVSRGILPGQQALDQLEGKCFVASPQMTFSPLGPSVSSTFYSHAHNRTLGYTIAWPPNHSRSGRLPLVIMLHGEGGNHLSSMCGMTPAQAMALHVGGRPLAPMALVTVDGGRGYWNPHPGDNPMAMVFDELIPLCQRLGLGRSPQRIGTMGISMGGYGAILFAEKYPRIISAVAAVSPAIWTSYAEAKGVNPGAYASAADFAGDDAVTHTAVLRGIPVRVASGDSDPFHPGVEALASALPPGSVGSSPRAVTRARSSFRRGLRPCRS